jgi:hypothetical protein
MNDFKSYSINVTLHLYARSFHCIRPLGVDLLFFPSHTKARDEDDEEGRGNDVQTFRVN